MIPRPARERATVGLAWVCAAVLALGGACRDRGTGSQPPETASAAVTTAMEQLQKEESDFLAKREALAAARRKVNEEKVALAERRKEAVASGGDVGAVEKEEQALAARESEITAEETQLAKGYDKLIAKYQEAAATSSSGDGVARREASVAVREKDFARREHELARREAELADRERGLAVREKEMCGGTVTTIVQAAPPPPAGSRYGKRDVEPNLKKARRRMAEKGILASDLPTPAQALEREATSAMAEGDYAKAKFAADQLLSMVESIQIDRSFIASKIGRLNAAMKAVKLDDAKRKEVDDLFRGATADYGDGKFPGANAKLNRIYGAIR